jgi:hypothetical protein
MHSQQQGQTQSTSNQVQHLPVFLGDFGTESSCQSPFLLVSSTQMSGSTRRTTVADGMILDSSSEPQPLWADQVPRQANEPEASNKSLDHYFSPRERGEKGVSKTLGIGK